MTAALWRQCGKAAAFRLHIWREKVIESAWSQRLVAQELEFLGMRGEESETRAIRALKQFATRVLKGDSGVMIRAWKLNYVDFRDLCVRTSLEQQLNGKMKESAVRNLQMILSREVKGGVVGRILWWRQQQLGLGGIRRAAVKGMAAILTRSQQGNYRSCFLDWSQLTQEVLAVHRAKSRVQVEMTFQLHKARKAAGETMCQRIALKWGLSGCNLLFQEWNKATAATAALVSKDKAMSFQRKGHGMAGMAGIMARLAKGEVGERVWLWAQGTKHALKEAQLAMMKQLERHGAGGKQLRQILTRRVKGMVGFRVDIWRGQVYDHNAASESVATAQAALAAKRGELKTVGMKNLTQIMTRLTKGDVAARILSWRQRQCSAHVARASFEARVVLRSREHQTGLERGIESLGWIFRRLVKGFASVLTFNWQQNAKEATRESARLGVLGDLSRKHKAATEDLEDMYKSKLSLQQLRTEEIATSRKHERMGQAVHLAHQLLVRHAKGVEMSFLFRWKQWKDEERSVKEHRGVVAERETRARDDRKRAGTKMIGQAFARVHKGYALVCLREWANQMGEEARQWELQVSSQGHRRLLKMKQQGTGLKGIAVAMARLARGEVSGCLFCWQWAKNRAKEEALEAFVASEDEAGKGKLKSVAMKNLKDIMRRMHQGEIACRLHIWKDSYVDDAAEFALATTQQAYGGRLKMGSQRAALRCLKTITARLRKEEYRSGLRIWQVRAHQGVMGSMNDYRKQAGIHRISMVMGSIAMGQTKAHLTMWHKMQRDDAFELKTIRDKEEQLRLMEAQGQNAGIMTLKRRMVRVLKGAAAQCITQWADNMKAYLADTAMRELRETHSLANKSRGLKQMALCLQRMGHRSIGLCLKVWILQQAEESCSLIQQVMQNALETQVKFENHTTGLTQLRQVFRRFLVSQARALTHRWRDRNKMHQSTLAGEDALVLHDNIRFEAELGAERVAEKDRKVQATRQLALIFRSLVKGVTSYRLELWRQRKAYSVLYQAATQSRSQGLQLLNRMMHSWKGEATAMVFRSWIKNKLANELLEQGWKQSALEDEFLQLEVAMTASLVGN